MSSELIGIGGLAALFILLIFRAPIGLAMLLAGVGGNYALSLVQDHFRFWAYLKQFKTLLWATVTNYELSILPLFILMGYISGSIGLSRDLFAGAAAVTGRLRGGTAIASVASCAGFGAVCGSSLATASTMGRIALPELRAAQYHPGFAAGILAAGGTLGILIPPSVVLVIYALIVEASIVEMFQAALLPGALAVLLFIAAIVVIGHLRPSLVGVARPSQNPRRDILRSLPVVLIFTSIILGLSAGLFTPTPAAAVGVFAILAYGLIIRRLNAANMRQSLLETSKTAAMITFVLFGAEVLKGFFTRAGLPSALSNWAQLAEISPLTIMLLMLLVFIVLGCFMDSLSMILVMVPFFWPTLVELNGGDFAAAGDAGFGMDIDALKLWFGVLCLIVVELGLMTPPVGLNVFIIGTIARDIPMAQIFKGAVPFLCVECVRIGLIVAFPLLALWLPALLSR